jgi:hypothetical protein
MKSYLILCFFILKGHLLGFSQSTYDSLVTVSFTSVDKILCSPEIVYDNFDPKEIEILRINRFLKKDLFVVMKDSLKRKYVRDTMTEIDLQLLELTVPIYLGYTAKISSTQLFITRSMNSTEPGATGQKLLFYFNREFPENNIYTNDTNDPKYFNDIFSYLALQLESILHQERYQIIKR